MVMGLVSFSFLISHIDKFFSNTTVTGKFKPQGGIRAEKVGFPQVKGSQYANVVAPPIMSGHSPIKQVINSPNIVGAAHATMKLKSTPEERAIELIKWLKTEKKLPRKKQLERKPLLVQCK